MPSPLNAESVERLARWLYERDSEEFVRIGWDEDSDGLKDEYRKAAQHAVDVMLGV